VSGPVLAIVPARGGSKGVPRKNLRALAGVPMFLHSVRAARESGVVDRLVVSTDDEEIIRLSEQHGVEVLVRPGELARDESTIADVAAHHANVLDWAGPVMVLQPTSPLRSAESVRRAVQLFRQGDYDSVATVSRQRHLYWFDEVDDLSAARPLFEARVNRQYAKHRVLMETGAIQLVRREVLVRSASMVGPRHRLMELPDAESLDIDTSEDLEAARRHLEAGTVVFRLTANSVVGSGHLHHCLQLADELADQNVHFLLRDCDAFVADALTARGLDFSAEEDLEQDLGRLRGPNTNLVVNDVLDTDEADVFVQRRLGYRVVNVEDLGPGARYADWVINALYAPSDRIGTHVSSGPRWTALRPEFHHVPRVSVRERATRILLTFGGTDPSHLSARLSTALAEAVPADVDVRLVLGAGAPEVHLPARVEVKRDISSMAKEMLAADVVITSAGRTVYEAAACGTPVVVVAQNAREATHAHLGLESGVVFLGIGPLVDAGHVVDVVTRLLDDAPLRRELSKRLQKSIDARGAERIAARIRLMLRRLDGDY
jgi:CMP-N-acetylneuraminic acid synthetase/spore coat polysaccharide biosynthesis predicted glycosyltransferase SpsG